ncbi:MAG: MMPL family transporter, partial [Opitutaceae bacterium]|nr:MMPL family transporter [Opitutaceae bacterium]
MNPLKQKWLARLLLLAGALSGVAWLWSLDFSQKISHDLLDLVPDGEQAAELAVVRSLANDRQARVALFALHAPDGGGGGAHGGGAREDGAAAAFAGALRASPAFAEVEAAGDTRARDALGRHVFERRLELLLPGWLAGKRREFEAAQRPPAAANPKSQVENPKSQNPKSQKNPNGEMDKSQSGAPPAAAAAAALAPAAAATPVPPLEPAPLEAAEAAEPAPPPPSNKPSADAQNGAPAAVAAASAAVEPVAVESVALVPAAAEEPALAAAGAAADFSGWLAERAAAELERFLTRPEALAFQEVLPADPLLLLPGLVETVMAAGGEPAAPAGVSLVWALTRDKPMDAAGQEPVFDAVAEALAAARAVEPGVSLRWTGIARFAEENSRRIRHEMSLLNVLSLAAVLGVAAACLRRMPKALHLAPVVLGAMLGAWVAATLAFERVHVLVFVIGSLLAGVAVDYGFYLYLQPPLHPGEHYGEKARRLAKPLLGSALTTVIGFSLLMFSDLPLIRQLGVFVSAGLLAALAAAVLWFAQVREPFMRTRAFARAQARPSRRGRAAAAAALGAIAAAALGGPWLLHWRDDIRELEIPVPELRREALELRGLFGESARRTVYLTRGATPGAAREALERFFAWHAEAFPGGAAASLGQALPLPGDWDAADARLAALERGGFAEKFRAALERREFDAAEFAPFFAAWRGRADAAAARQAAGDGGGDGDGGTGTGGLPGGAALDSRGYDGAVRALAEALRGRVALLMSTAPGGCWFLTVANHAPGAEPPAGSGTIGLDQLETLNRLFARYRVSALRLSALGLALVGLSMWVIYGVGRGTRIFATPVGSCLFAFGVLGLAGQTLNLFHLLGAFLGVCLSHNYAIFDAENDARGEEPPPSIRLSALTTAASFGVLALSRIPVVKALGSTVALIVLGALAIVELKRVARGRAGGGGG